MLAILVAIVLAAEPTPEQAQAATEEQPLGISAEELRGHLIQRGHHAEIGQSPLGRDMINGSLDGMTYRVFLSDCSKGYCRRLRFSLSLPARRSTLEMMNLWNRNSYSGMATLDEKGLPELQLDVPLECPTSDNALTAVRNWERMLPEFLAYSRPADR